MRISFRFRWIPFFATIAVATIGILLGQWQTRRAEQKEGIQHTLLQRQAAPILSLNSILASIVPSTATPTLSAINNMPEEWEYRRMRVAGEFVRDWPLYLDNRPYQSRAGLVVLMPFKIAGSDTYVLVARGWLARDRVDRARVQTYPTVSGRIEIEGVVRRNPGRLMQLGAQQVQPAAILQNLEIAEFAAASKLKMQPFLIEQTASAMPDQSDPLVRDWPLPSSGIEKHRGYAFQWFGLALTAFIFFVVTGFRHGTK